MTKKIVFVVALILAAGIGGWLFYSQQQEVITTVEPVTSTVVKKTEKPEKTAEEHLTCTTMSFQTRPVSFLLHPMTKSWTICYHTKSFATTRSLIRQTATDTLRPIVPTGHKYPKGINTQRA